MPREWTNDKMTILFIYFIYKSEELTSALALLFFNNLMQLPMQAIKIKYEIEGIEHDTLSS